MRLDVMSGGVPIRAMQGLAADVEDAGFGGIWITESGRSAYNLCTAAALSTGTLDVGTGSGALVDERALVIVRLNNGEWTYQP